MKFVREVCIAGPVIDVALKYTQRQLSVRAPKGKPTREAVLRNNDRIAEKRLTRIMNANFYPGDWHVTLTYALVPSQEEAKRKLDNFLRRMKREFKKLGKEMRYVVVTEYENHRIHHHIVMNFIDGEIIRRQWKEGRVRYTNLDESRNYKALASYLIKETQKTFRKSENMTKRRYRCSRNLVHPVVMTQPVKLSKAILDEPKPFKGYAIDEDSIRRFENPITHITHMEYMMVATDPVPRISKWRKGTTVRRDETYQRAEELKQLELSDYESSGAMY